MTESGRRFTFGRRVVKPKPAAAYRLAIMPLTQARVIFHLSKLLHTPSCNKEKVAVDKIKRHFTSVIRFVFAHVSEAWSSPPTRLIVVDGDFASCHSQHGCHTASTVLKSQRLNMVTVLFYFPELCCCCLTVI